MNKTVDINLANILFHIDEKAFNKLQRYIEAIKRSFAGTTGSDEIIADIEARIAELFQEKIENERQVVTLKEVDEVIAIMGQPEDYMVDDDLFEDRTSTGTRSTGRVKKLYRDIDNKYIGGVCAGLEHYLGIDALWIRLIFILLAVFTGFGLIAYILLWILVPEAATTSQKLDMTGKPVNISNIEQKVKEGFEDVADKVRSVDYEKVGTKVKSSSKTFFDTLGDVIMFLFKVVGKFIGILLIIIGAATLIGLFIGLFTVGVLDIIHVPGLDFQELVNYTDTPVWVVSFLTFLAVGIPFFFLMYLGLKILVNNLKSIGNIAKFSLLGLWVISVIGLVALGIKQAAAQAFTGSETSKSTLVFTEPLDTLRVGMEINEFYADNDNLRFISDMSLTYNEDGDKILYSDDIRFDIRKAEDSLAQIRVRKEATGSSYMEASQRAGAIDYGYAVKGKAFMLNDHFTTAADQKFRDQEVRVTLYLPEGTVVKFDDRTRYHLGRSTRFDKDLYRKNIVKQTWKVDKDGMLVCLDCPVEVEQDYDEDGHIIIDDEGIDIDIKDNGESFKMRINEEGVKIETQEN